MTQRLCHGQQTTMERLACIIRPPIAAGVLIRNVVPATAPPPAPALSSNAAVAAVAVPRPALPPDEPWPSIEVLEGRVRRTAIPLLLLKASRVSRIRMDGDLFCSAIG